jgi:hypothetical protein
MLVKDEGVEERKVRIHFLNETWDLVLAGKTEFVLEHWNVADQNPDRGPISVVDLYVKGAAIGTIAGREIRFTENTQMFWVNREPSLRGPEPMKEIPDWWRTPPAPGISKEMNQVLIALIDSYDAVSGSDAVMAEINTQVKESSDPVRRSIGVLFLGAVDALPQILNNLESQHASVRYNAAFVLRNWINRSRYHETEVLSLVGNQHGFGYSKDTADLFIRLLRGFSPDQMAKPEITKLLVENLQHKNAAIRELAIRNLALYRTDLAKEIQYSAVEDVNKRELAAKEWSKRLSKQIPAK